MGSFKQRGVKIPLPIPDKELYNCRAYDWFWEKWVKKSDRIFETIIMPETYLEFHVSERAFPYTICDVTKRRMLSGVTEKAVRDLADQECFARFDVGLEDVDVFVSNGFHKVYCPEPYTYTAEDQDRKEKILTQVYNKAFYSDADRERYGFMSHNPYDNFILVCNSYE